MSHPFELLESCQNVLRTRGTASAGTKQFEDRRIRFMFAFSVVLIVLSCSRSPAADDVDKDQLLVLPGWLVSPNSNQLLVPLSIHRGAQWFLPFVVVDLEDAVRRFQRV